MTENNRAEAVRTVRFPARVLQHPVCTAVVSILFCLVFILPAAVSAGAVVIDTSSISNEAGITTIPVYLTGANDILSFAAEVSNTQPGVTVTLSESVQSERGMTVINSDPANSLQRVAWISSTGVTADRMLMFAVEVKVTDASVTSIPLQITLTEIASDAKGMLPVSTYPVSSSSFMITDTISCQVSPGNPGDVPTPVTPLPTSTGMITPTPATPDAENQEPTPLPTSDNPAAIPTTSGDILPLSGESETPLPPATPQSPGFSAIGLLMSLGSAVFISRRVK